MEIRTNREIAKYAEMVIKQHMVATDRSQEDCQYYDKTNGCRATTQDTCINCRFYNPTFASRLRILAQDNMLVIEEKENALSDLREAMECLKKSEDYINILETQIMEHDIIECCHHGEM